MKAIRVTPQILGTVTKIMVIAMFTASLSLAVVTPVSAATRNNCSGSSRPILRSGDKGSCVSLAQELLAAKGVLSATPNGNFGPATKAAAIRLQTNAGINGDGVIGRDTWRALQGSASPSTNNSSSSTSSLPARCLTTAKTICIIKGRGSEATLYAIKNKAIAKSFAVRTGDARGSDFATSNGDFSVGWKSKDHVSSIYDAPMPYSLFFNGGQAIHYSADFDTNGYGGAGASHGCVNVGSLDDARWLFNWARERTPVIVT